MSLLFYSFNLILILISIIRTTENNMSIDSYDINHYKLCSTYDGIANITGQPPMTIQDFAEIVWKSITEHIIFKRMAQSNDTDNSFVEVKNELKNVFEIVIKQKFKIEAWDPFILDKFDFSVQIFINEIVDITIRFYNTLGICFKDVLEASSSVENAIKDIIYKNTCYVFKGIGEIPGILYRMCNTLISHNKNCYGLEGKENIVNVLKENRRQISKAVCYEDMPIEDNNTVINHESTYEIGEALSTFIHDNFYILMGINAFLIIVVVSIAYWKINSACGSLRGRHLRVDKYCKRVSKNKPKKVHEEIELNEIRV
ncbi:putative SP-containing membrane protein [Vairimorpha necatrix]|uniref:SP-containing membrane protein n=1 Tax=Vairimorpha necatrix TaxID=6039 RepID=A0AAX4JCD1_9MICR